MLYAKSSDRRSRYLPEVELQLDWKQDLRRQFVAKCSDRRSLLESRYLLELELELE